MSTEQYLDPPLYDLRFPDKQDLVNYTKSKDISEITIPSSFIKERDHKNGEYTVSQFNGQISKIKGLVSQCLLS